MTYDQLINNLRRHNPIARYKEMGSRNKKTGKLNYYTVTRNLINGAFECSCPATSYRPWLAACKHIKRLKEKLRLP